MEDVIVDHHQADEVKMDVEQDLPSDSSPKSASPNSVWTIYLRNPKLPNGQVAVPTSPDGEVENLVDFISEVLGEASLVESEFAKIILKGKKLDLHSTVSSCLRDGDTVLLMFSARKEIEAMRMSDNVDRSIRSIEE